MQRSVLSLVKVIYLYYGYGVVALLRCALLKRGAVYKRLCLATCDTAKHSTVCDVIIHYLSDILDSVHWTMYIWCKRRFERLLRYRLMVIGCYFTDRFLLLFSYSSIRWSLGNRALTQAVCCSLYNRIGSNHIGFKKKRKGQNNTVPTWFSSISPLA